MDTETYEQIPLSKEQIGEEGKFLRENTKAEVLSHKGKVIGIELPKFVELKVTYTEPGKKGDTATNVYKPAVVEGDIEVRAPLFINIGDMIKIDTRTGKYVERV